MDGILLLIILLGILSIASLVCEVLAIISLIKYVHHNIHRKRGILFCVLAALLAYLPLLLIFGYLIFRYGMIITVVFNLILIIRFLKK